MLITVYKLILQEGFGAGTLGELEWHDKIAIKEVPLFSTRVTVVDRPTTRDLGVVRDRQLSLDAHVTAVFRSDYYQLRQLYGQSHDHCRWRQLSH